MIILTNGWKNYTTGYAIFSKSSMHRPAQNEVFCENEKPLDNQNLCQMLHISPRTLQRYRSEGMPPFFKRGQKIYYKTSDVRAFVYKNGDHWDKKAFDDATKAKDEE
jgi:hypothetical protein